MKKLKANAHAEKRKALEISAINARNADLRLSEKRKLEVSNEELSSK